MHYPYKIVDLFWSILTLGISPKELEKAMKDQFSLALPESQISIEEASPTDAEMIGSPSKEEFKRSVSLDSWDSGSSESERGDGGFISRDDS
jgi:hypothetical protein